MVGQTLSGTLNPRRIDVNQLIRGLSDLLHRTLGENLSVETIRGAGLWAVEADPNELEAAAIINLAVNARDAMGEGGSLTIETSNAHIDETYAKAYAEVLPGEYVAIPVTDTGIGMDEATIAHAFEPFFTTKPTGRGTGLGLSQVYGFVKQSGGHVKIYSEVGQGRPSKSTCPGVGRGTRRRACSRSAYAGRLKLSPGKTLSCAGRPSCHHFRE